MVSCKLCLILHLEGSMNLKTVPKGDMALGYEVAKKYSSPKKNRKELMSTAKLEQN